MFNVLLLRHRYNNNGKQQYSLRKTHNNMTSIITQVNDLTKSSFTKMVKSRSNAGACFLIVALADGGSIYGSYSSDAVYYVSATGEKFGFRK